MNQKTNQPRVNKKTALLFTTMLLIIGMVTWYAWGVIWQDTVSTEDAYVEGNIVPVTAQVSGTITDIHADNTDQIHQGDIVIRINSTDAKIALSKATAQLAATVRSVRNQYATLSELKSAIDVKLSDYNKALADFKRRTALSRSSAISLEDMNHSLDALNQAKAALDVSRKQYEAAQTLTENTTLQTHPDVLSAQAAVRESWVNLYRTEIVSPTSGLVAQRTAQVGQHISSGSTLLSVISLDSLWVTANFKESQLSAIKEGQKVKLISDVYGRKKYYHGYVLGIEPGTGSAFSLLPAQNATGNWIKVVQRVPVRIALQSDELKKHPLRPGLSMKVIVDTSKSADDTLPVLKPASDKMMSTTVYREEEKGADALIQDIMNKND
ncbi:HlyD family secretion protein [Citrobacter amalonaticus]|uniref:HlyD family secretion protein n=1 Tax=Citrobacter amalonaticus TaxID=35703 RepID=UPI00190745AF|nr:HlyD family efflux transporter periplasmic adaptor subunit [Citrobacter amalonaticus]MBJ9863588.1 HlyD family efflux transporter periplasmic adaptor subunit [Citrobacter amalonaticus]